MSITEEVIKIQEAVDILQKRYDKNKDIIYNTYNIKSKNQVEITDENIQKLQSENNELWAVIMILNKFYK